jgi:hypothetical protein
MYAVSSDGKRWFRLTDFKSEVSGVADGYTGPAFTPDGKRAAWNQIVDGNVFKYRPAGKWELVLATFDDSDGVPKFINPKNITPAGMYWNEVGNFNPKDGSLLLLTGAMEKDAEKNSPLVLGMDQYTLNVDTLKLTNLTKSPATWNEHGVFSPNGEKIVFMSSQPYKSEPLSATLLGIKTEFMLMNKDGSGLTQLTHFREPGHPEFGEGMAACGGFNPDGRSLQLSRLIFPKYEYWELTFKKK